MNSNSKICTFISQNPDWRQQFNEVYHISYKEESPYIVFNYGIECNFSDPLVQEARGIIIDIDYLDVVCWPFRKFGNYECDYADPIDWRTARVQDKLDGSIIKLWYDRINECWTFSTNSTIHAEDAPISSPLYHNFLELIRQSANFGDIDFALLDEDLTYIFELVSPYNQVVIKYEETKLYHIGTRNNITGLECVVDIGVEKPHEYPLHSLDDCIEAAIHLNQNSSGEVGSVRKEGFVVVDDNWNRIKVKSPDYLMLHHILSNSNFSKKRVVNLIRNDAIDIAEICDDFPDYAHILKYYDFKVSELDYQAKVFCDLTRRIYTEYDNDRKVVAEKIKKHRLSGIGFNAIGNEKTSKEILNEMPDRSYFKLIPDYNPERLSEVFYGGENK